MAKRFSAGQIPKDIPTWQYEAFRTIGELLNRQGKGMSAIARGENPLDGGDLVNLNDYFYLPGRNSGQLGHGDTRAGGLLTFSSTRSLTKGYIYLGADHVCIYDETNGCLGIGLG
jgi:hypothetical protein